MICIRLQILRLTTYLQNKSHIHIFLLGYSNTVCKIITMQGLAIFLGLLSASSALYISPVNRPLYDLLTASKKLTSGADQRLDCYDQTNCYGSRITIGTSPVPDLNSSPYYFDNRIQSCNYNGIYLLYDGRNYNQDNLNVSMITLMVCENLVQGIRDIFLLLNLFSPITNSGSCLCRSLGRK